jgi:hypothetical protein
MDIGSLAGPSVPVDAMAAGVGALPAPQPEAPPPPIIPMLHDVVVVRRKNYGCAKVEPVPPEEFGISRRAKTIRDATYVYHETTKTQAELIDLGFDETQVKNLPSGEGDEEESQARDTVDETDESDTGTLNEATRPIQVTEHYVRMDYTGKGARLYCVTTGGDDGDILKKKNGDDAIAEVDEIPFASVTPIVMPHRFFGRSIADIVMDIQRIKTALLRSLLDNVYLANNQRTEVGEDGATANTIDDLLNNRPGGIVRTKRVGSIAPIPNNSIGDFAYPMIEYMDSTREMRTGFTKQSAGIDANALQNQTAEAVGKFFTAAQARQRLIARIFAETGVKDLFLLLHAIIRKNDTQASTVRLRNKWVEVDPRQWKTRNDMTVNVGLGIGTKEQQIAFLMGLLTVQEKALMSGTGLVTPKHIYSTLEKLVELGGLRSAELYFQDPAEAPPQQPKPDPKMIEVEGKLKLQAAEAQADQQLAQQKAQAELQLSQAKAQEEARQSVEQMKAEFALELEKMRAEHQLEMVRMRMQERMGMQQNQTKERVGMDSNARKANLTAVRPGGKVG